MLRTLVCMTVVTFSLLTSCNKKDEKKQAPQTPAVNTPPGNSGGDLMTLDDPQPPLPRKKLPPSPRIKARPFKLLAGTMEPLTMAPKGTLLVDAGDFLGDSKLEFIFLGFRTVTIFAKGLPTMTAVGPSVPLLVKVFREKGKKHDSFLVAWGRGREHRGAPLSLWLYRVKGNKLQGMSLYTPKTDRPDAQDLLIDQDGTITFAHFTSKYKVAVVSLAPPYNTAPTVIDQINMVTKLARITEGGKQRLVMGRLYGDVAGSEGDLFIYGEKGKREKLPSKRGVRSLISATFDAARGECLIVGDGWHKNYGQIARAHLARLCPVKGKWERTELDTLKSNFAILSLDRGDLDGDKKEELVGKGNNTLAVWYPSQNWKRVIIAHASGYKPISVKDVDGDGRAEIILSEPSPTLIRLSKKK